MGRRSAKAVCNTSSTSGNTSPISTRYCCGTHCSPPLTIAGYSAQGKANATALSVRTIGRYFGLSLGGVVSVKHRPRPVPRAISWQELCDTIDDRFDIAAESRRLKENPEKFETIRNEYRYREEYF